MQIVRDTSSTGGPTKRVGSVLAGAVARGAHEAVALSVLLPELEERGERPKVLVGTSSGALNAAFLASRADDPAEHAVKELLDLWRTIKRRGVYRWHVGMSPMNPDRFKRDSSPALNWQCIPSFRIDSRPIAPPAPRDREEVP